MSLEDFLNIIEGLIEPIGRILVIFFLMVLIIVVFGGAGRSRYEALEKYLNKVAGLLIFVATLLVFGFSDNWARDGANWAVAVGTILLALVAFNSLIESRIERESHYIGTQISELYEPILRGRMVLDRFKADMISRYQLVFTPSDNYVVNLANTMRVKSYLAGDKLRPKLSLFLNPPEGVSDDDWERIKRDMIEAAEEEAKELGEWLNELRKS